MSHLTLQSCLVLAIVAWAVVYLGRRAWRAFQPGRVSGCGSCPQSRRQPNDGSRCLVTIELPDSHRTPPTSRCHPS